MATDVATGKRIVQIAKYFNISHKDIMDLLKKNGIEVKSHMSLVDEEAYQLILEEFEQDRLSVERYRKEQVRKEIHSKKLEETLQSSQSFEIMMPKEQRIIEEKEKKLKEEEENIKKEEEAQKAKEEKKKSKKPSKTKNGKSEKNEIESPERDKMQFRSIDVAEIQAKIETPRRRATKKKPPETDEEKAKHASIESTIKKTMAQVDTKAKRKKYKKTKDDDVDFDGDIIRKIKMTEFMTVQEIAKILDISPPEIISKCFELGIPATMNQRLNFDTISLISEDVGVEAVQVEETSDELFSFDNTEEDVKKAVPRAPVVTIMGHVDHGKTSLLDYIRDTNVVAGESGGITQHIGAYEVILEDGKQITFLDTPGHEAFTAMRARGAQITDIVILVVAADDAVMPQTKEAISHTKAAGVPMVVAINKMDKPGADAEKVRRSLSEHEVLTESWGGKIQDIEISAKTGAGIDSLMESILLETDVLELKANKDCKARGTVIDSRLDKGLGPIGTVLIQKGTLKIGDPFICGDFSGKVRSISNEHGVRLKNAGPSDAIQIQGYDQVPQAADLFAVVDDEKELKRISSERQRIRREIAQKKMAFSLDHMSSLIKEGTVNTLPMVIKGDVDGSVEALAESLEKLNTSEVGIKVIHKAVGMVTESDVLLAEASKAVIIGFHVQVSSNARLQAQQAGVDIRTYNVIYQAVEELTLALEGMLEPDKVESSIGKAEVLTQFKIPKIGFIAGCKVVEGLIIRNGKARVSRDGEVIAEGLINSLKRHKDDSKEVKEGLECGIGVDGIKKFQEGDIIEVYEIREVKRKLELN